MKLPPSIFNDVVGPVMRGPSSSHTAASVRIGNLSTGLLRDPIIEALIEFHPKGSLATTYRSQGSAIGLVAGLLGYDTKASEIITAEEEAAKKGLRITFRITDYQANHPNTYRISLKSISGETASLTAISTGGGMIEIIEINGFAISICGDFHETLLQQSTPLHQTSKNALHELETKGLVDYVLIIETAKGVLVNIKSKEPLSAMLLNGIQKHCETAQIRQLQPVLPTLSRKKCTVPFLSAAEIIDAASKNQTDLAELALLYESIRGACSKLEVWEKMSAIVHIMQTSIESGLQGTTYEDRILGSQSGKIQEAIATKKAIPCELNNTVIACTMAMMEVKSSMGVIVAAPTAGACAVLPGSILGMAKALNLNHKQCVKAMLAAGLIGVLIVERSTFSAEICGCQAECGAGSGMAAAGIVQMMNGSAEQAIHAASMSLQNIMGMVCDPVANRVEVPCLGKNVMGAVNAIAMANMALAGIDAVIPLDEVIHAMDIVGRSIPRELRCTGYGGLSITPASKKIEQMLTQKSQYT